MKVTLFGAAGDVTGSAYFLETKHASILIDCGIFQGGKNAETKNKTPFPFRVTNLDAVVLTHAHLDHTGRLPLLLKQGFQGPIYATQATIEMASLILRDSAKVQMFDVERINRKRKRQGLQPIKPLYTSLEVDAILALFKPVDYLLLKEISSEISIRFHEAGHILGSSSIEVSVNENGHHKTVLFSGDLGPSGMAILKDPELFTSADLVFMESTYGNRDHRSLKETLDQSREIIQQAIETGGKVIVPAFAVGRTQQLLYYLSALHPGVSDKFPVYVDSPMAIEATNIYLRHPELFDEEATELLKSGHLKADLSHVKYCHTPEESMALNNLEGPLMIIAGSGMCNAGRVLHHLKHNLWNPNNAVIIAGFQAEGTLGRRLVDGVKQVSIFGERIKVNAKIHLLGGLSAHAGQSDLLNWFHSLAASKPKLVLSHGEDKARITLAELIKQRYGIEAILPGLGDVVKG